MGDHLAKQVKAIDEMDLAGLRAKYAELYGIEPVSRNTKALRGQLKRKLQRMDIDARKKGRAQPGDAGTVTERVAALTKMSLEELRTEFEKVIGKQSKSRNRTQLVKRIAEKLQQDSYQGKMAGGARPSLTVTAKFERKKRTRSKLVAKPESKKGERKRARNREPGQRDPRLPKAGTDLVREWHGKRYVVRVLESGFEHNSKPFRSLSAVAKHITGQIVNGFAWFGLTGNKKKP